MVCVLGAWKVKGLCVVGVSAAKTEEAPTPGPGEAGKLPLDIPVDMAPTPLWPVLPLLK